MVLEPSTDLKTTKDKIIHYLTMGGKTSVHVRVYNYSSNRTDQHNYAMALLDAIEFEPVTFGRAVMRWNA